MVSRKAPSSSRMQKGTQSSSGKQLLNAAARRGQMLNSRERDDDSGDDYAGTNGLEMKQSSRGGRGSKNRDSDEDDDDEDDDEEEVFDLGVGDEDEDDDDADDDDDDDDDEVSVLNLIA